MLHKVLLIASVSILLGACVVTPTYTPGTFVWVGCHKEARRLCYFQNLMLMI